MRGKSGFTLLEVVVAIGLFTIAALLTSGIFVALVGGRDAASQKEGLKGELRTLVDTFGREVTWAVALPTGCEATPCSTLAFVIRGRGDISEKEVYYEYDAAGQTVKKAEQKTFGACNVRPVSGSASCKQAALSPNIKVQVFQISIVNNVDGEEQVTVTVRMKGYMIVKGKTENFSVSSSFTPRLLQDQSSLSSGPPVPELLSVGQRCKDYAMVVKVNGDRKSFVHVERCQGSGCTSGFTAITTPGTEKNDADTAFHVDNTICSSPPVACPNIGVTYGYRVVLHDHSIPDAPNNPDLINGWSSPIKYKTLAARTGSEACTSGGGQPPRPNPITGGGGGEDNEGGGGKTGEQ